MANYEKAQEAYWQACKEINVKENEQIVLECKTSLCYNFALNILGADIKAHEKVILELNSSRFSYCFARFILGANIEDHFKIIFNSGDKVWLDEFIQFVNYKGTKVEEWILYI